MVSRVSAPVVEAADLNARYFSHMSPWLFWGLFFLFAGYYLVVKIGSVDLWWHLACGRYFFENGSYPVPGTFTFSPVVASTGNAKTWLGDLFLYTIHAFAGNEIGLQLFRIIAIVIPVVVFVRLSGKQYNTWTLLGGQILVWGTMQQHFVRNSIFAMIFLPLMVLIWHMANRDRRFKLLFVFPLIFLFWTHMHGYALVGLVILILFFIGDIIDQVMGKVERSNRFALVFLIVLIGSWGIVSMNWSLNPVSIMRNLLNPLNSYLSAVEKQPLQNQDKGDGNGYQPLAVSGSKGSVNDAFSDGRDGYGIRGIIPMNWIQDPINRLGSIFTPRYAHASEEGGAPDLDPRTFRGAFSAVKDKIKWLFRPFLRGGDAEYIEEYRSPFDAWNTLPAKVVFVFALIYAIYLIIAFKFDRSGLKFSYLLPSAACIFLGLGHLRTMAFPFLVALPLMAAHMTTLSIRLRDCSGETSRFFMNNMLPWTGLLAYLCIVSYFYPQSISHPLYLLGLEGAGDSIGTFLSNFKTVVFTLMCGLMVVHLGLALGSEKGETSSFYRILFSVCVAFAAVAVTAIVRPGHFLDQPVGFLVIFTIIPVVVVGVWRMAPASRHRWYFRFNPLLFWWLPLLFSVQFALATHCSYVKTGYLDIAGIFDRKPGIGKSHLFSDSLPDHVLEKYNGEDIFNSYNIGGYLIWKWYADKKVFIDSRSVNYKNDFYEDYRRNYAYKYFERLNLEKALLSISVDKAWYDEYLSQNWTPIALDTSMVLLKRRVGKGYSPSYGIIPQYIGKTADIDRLSRFERQRFGLFINDILRFMLLFGRVADTAHWIEALQPVIQKLDAEEKSHIQGKSQFVNLLVDHFGKVNDPVLADACRQLEEAYSTIKLNLVIGNVHKSKNQLNEAAKAYLAAARLGPKNAALQRQVADQMFEMKLINQAIAQYEAFARLQPGVVDAYLRLGYLYSLKKDYPASERHLRQLLVYAPTMKEAYFNLASVLAASGKKAEAIQVYETGLTRLPGNKELQMRMGLLKQELE